MERKIEQKMVFGVREMVGIAERMLQVEVAKCIKNDFFYEKICIYYFFFVSLHDFSPKMHSLSSV